MLDAHPAIGQTSGLSARSAAEQGSDDDPEVLAELARLNADVRGAARVPLRRLRQPAAEGGDPRRAARRASTTRPTRSSRRRSASSSRSPSTAGSADDDGVAAFLDPYVTDWLNLLIRWLHVIAAIAWIGASFYFVLLDQSLEAPTKVEDLRDGVGGELWEVHGGGFYHVKKYKVAPPVLPEHLAWFKWEAYTTWLSGFALMVVLYYFNASAYLIDPAVADLTSWEAVGISIGLLVAAWVVYDVLCRLLVRHDARALGAARRADGRRGLGVHAAVPAARRLPPGRRDARHDHGRERLLQHHPGALGADQRQARRPRARPDAGHRRQAALGAQQLLHAAGAVHDDRRALRVHLRSRPRLARAARDHVPRRAGRGSSSTCATRAARSGRSPPSARSCSSCSPSRSAPTSGVQRRGARLVLRGRSRDRAALRPVPRARRPTQDGFSSPPAGVVLETPAQIAAGPTTSSGSSRRTRCRSATSPG